MAKVVNINHVGIVVQDNEKSLKFWRDLLNVNLKCIEPVPSMEINLAWLPINTGFIELVEPITTESNEYYNFLQTCGPGVHHVCLEVDDIYGMVEKLKENNVRFRSDSVIDLPGRKLIFLDPSCCDGVMVELYELL